LSAKDAQFEKLFCVCGIAVEHDLRLDGVRTASSLCARRAQVGGVVSMMGVRLEPSANIEALSADEIAVGGSFYASGQFAAKSRVQLEGAKIGGKLVLDGARIEAPQKVALVLDHAEIRLGLMARNLSVVGTVRMHHAQIGCQVSLRSASLENANGDALQADHLVVRGALMLNDGFHASGAIDLHGSEIDCHLNLTDARIDGIRAGDTALVLGAASVHGDIVARRAVIAGKVQASAVVMSGSMSFPGAKIGVGGQGVALVLARAQIGGSVSFGDECECRGRLSLADCTVGTTLDLSESTFSNENGVAVLGSGLTLRGDLRGNASKYHGFVDLAGATFGGEVRFTDSLFGGVPSRSSTYGEPAE